MKAGFLELTETDLRAQMLWRRPTAQGQDRSARAQLPDAPAAGELR
jgi:hypothetical protein